MMFRKIYWVTEQFSETSSQVTGVYTSIPDLIRSGLRWTDEPGTGKQLRLTLVKLDSDKGPLGSWMSPHFEGLADDLNPFVVTDEFRIEEIQRLGEALDLLMSVETQGSAGG